MWKQKLKRILKTKTKNGKKQHWSKVMKPILEKELQIPYTRTNTFLI